MCVCVLGQMLTTPLAKPLFDSIHHIYHFQGKVVSTLKQCTLVSTSQVGLQQQRDSYLRWVDTLGVPTHWNPDSRESTRSLDVASVGLGLWAP